MVLFAIAAEAVTRVVGSAAHGHVSVTRRRRRVLSAFVMGQCHDTIKCYGPVSRHNQVSAARPDTCGCESSDQGCRLLHENEQQLPAISSSCQQYSGPWRKMAIVHNGVLVLLQSAASSLAATLWAQAAAASLCAAATCCCAVKKQAQQRVATALVVHDCQLCDKQNHCSTTQLVMMHSSGCTPQLHAIATECCVALCGSSINMFCTCYLCCSGLQT